MSQEYDAIVVGSGPNGFAAAITLQQKGLSVLLIEGEQSIGGGMRTKELFGPGNWSDICSAIHPMAAGSPFFQSLSLENFGLEYIHPEILAAHPFDDGTAAILKKSLEETASSLGQDETIYKDIFSSLIKDWPIISKDVLGPLHWPAKPSKFLKFGVNALLPASIFSKKFVTEKAKGLWAGMAAHSLLPLNKLTTSAIGLVLMANGHIGGWPIPKGGSQSLANALASLFTSIGGKIEVGHYVNDISELPSSKVVLFDTSPKMLVNIASNDLPDSYKRKIEKFRYGAGVFKMDWLLREPIPFVSENSRRAGTVHIGGTLQEIGQSEYDVAKGKISGKPFVLLAQQSLFDKERVTDGNQIVWGYCHVPNGSTVDCTEIIENQIERFAPGFKDLIIDRHSFNTQQIQSYNPNYIGGDINGGMLDIAQLYSRPILQSSPYRTPNKRLYLCSASTPPGGGVHGMSGYYAAKRVLKEHWNIEL
ncbi:MAG: FAD-dependent oxidoreductase [Pseudopedobacter saltans]|uniref:FAD-dependent oxidoreductase n=1 Tax=Pseudopedobacter saltans TaxID=151895 RepID=A0A2W5GY42_9SPHI|nr:MAG: FAD-dependent oxidoreductase [Pseudopedobacter saltans]